MRTVYGGIPVQVPGSKVSELLKLPGVAAVQADVLEQVLTDSSPDFIGATPVYPQLGGTGNAGAGIIVGVLDTGAWPEHVSYTDPGNLPAPPPKADGTPRTCNFGDNPLTPANDPFVCNHKLIGGQPFINTYNAVVGGEVFPDSARDSNGHGTHTVHHRRRRPGGQRLDARRLRVGPSTASPPAPPSPCTRCAACGAASTRTWWPPWRRPPRTASTSSTSPSPAGPTPTPTPSSWASSTLYAGGTFIAASAGNSGPGAGTVDHNGPWVTTVAASTQERAFQSTLTLNGPGGHGHARPARPSPPGSRRRCRS